MHSGVIRIQNMTQNKLNGSPRTMGYTRSQSDTEKQVARKGMRPMRRALMDGRFTVFEKLGSISIRGILAAAS
jgi:hypothetical protein